MVYGQKVQMVRDYLADHPDATAKDIARETKLDINYVNVTLCRIRKSSSPGLFPIGPTLSQHPELFAWLRRECPSGLPLAEFIVAILIDAMLEDES